MEPKKPRFKVGDKVIITNPRGPGSNTGNQWQCHVNKTVFRIEKTSHILDTYVLDGKAVGLSH